MKRKSNQRRQEAYGTCAYPAAQHDPSASARIDMVLHVSAAGLKIADHI
ncbi:MAG: hypothetical protein ACP5FQ_04185 [Thermoplasmata archaeon]